jgi:hypothetical protein
MRKARYGPVKAVGVIDAGGGHVKYPLKGGRWIVSKRRKRAFRVMSKHCGGKKYFAILREYSKEDAQAPYHGGELDIDKLTAGEHYKVYRYRHILFTCRKP